MRFPQSIEPYLVNVRGRTRLAPLQLRYKEAYYGVWSPEYTPEPLAKVQWPFQVYTSENAYGENLRPLPESWFETMEGEAYWERYGSIGKPAIALARLDLRNFPTAKPLFHTPCEAGEGFPFDYLQNSSVFADEPLYLSHYSKSGAWAYVLTSYATGWVPAEKVALIDADKRQAWQERPLLALLQDRMPMHTAKGDYLFEGYTGMLLPLDAETADGFSADAVIVQGIRTARVIGTEVPMLSAAVTPMAFNRDNLGRVIGSVLQTKYGWGGQYGDRDCSSTLRDVFAPFGVWLPRNSFQQSNIGRRVSFEGMSDAEKMEAIKTQGRPFETLLYIKGHILLYLGLYDGEPVALHTVWGVKTIDGNGIFDRHIIGKTVISSLRLGRELDGYSETYSLLHQIESMNFIFEEGSEAE